MRAERLLTGRLALDPLRVADADELAPLLDDPALHAFTGGAPEGVDALRARFARQVRGRSPDGSARWFNWVVRRRADGVAVGTAQATVRAGEAELAWVIGTAHQRQGYAREAAVAVAAWVRAHDAGPVVAHIHPGHAASAAVAAAAGLHPTDRRHEGETRWEG